MVVWNIRRDAVGTCLGHVSVVLLVIRRVLGYLCGWVEDAVKSGSRSGCSAAGCRCPYLCDPEEVVGLPETLDQAGVLMSSGLNKKKTNKHTSSTTKTRKKRSR